MAILENCVDVAGADADDVRSNRNRSFHFGKWMMEVDAKYGYGPCDWRFVCHSERFTPSRGSVSKLRRL